MLSMLLRWIYGDPQPIVPIEELQPEDYDDMGWPKDWFWRQFGDGA